MARMLKIKKSYRIAPSVNYKLKIMLSELEKMLPEGERQMAGISLTETALIEKAVHHYYLKYEQSKQDKQSLVKLMIS